MFENDPLGILREIKEQAKQHFYLASGKVIFSYKTENNEPITQVKTVDLNSIITSEKNAVNRDLIGLIHKQLQYRLFQIEDHNKIEVQDVFIYSISYLGAQTEKEFYGTNPENLSVPNPSTESKVTPDE